jgi:hypothetical protein
MKLQFIDIIFCSFAYVVLIFFVIKRYHMKNQQIDNDQDDDDDGGIEINNLPDLDLPPGICLPSGPEKFDKELVA